MPKQLKVRRWVGVSPKGKIESKTLADNARESWFCVDVQFSHRLEPNDEAIGRLKAEGWRVKRCTITVDLD
jgi:hypothetical protein